MKKILAIFLSLTLFVWMNSFVLVSEAGGSTDFLNDLIVEQAIGLDEVSELQEMDFRVVTLEQNETSALSVNETERVIQSVSSEGDMVKVTTIYPYKQLSNGELINSFEYTPSQITTLADEATHDFVDVIVTTLAYFYTETSQYNLVRVYRHAGIEAYWSSDSSVTVSNLKVYFDSAGELHMYPECITRDFSETLVQSNYEIHSLINQNNPIENQVYLDGSNTMPLNRVLNCSDSFYHGGVVSVVLTYTANGVTRTDSHSYTAYGKGVG